jgi:DNA polymerase-3 subunit alpha
MDTLGFYYHEHDLKNTHHPEFHFINFFEENEIPTPSEYKEIKGRKIPVHELKSILGTVLDKNSYKHTITLLTPDGVVNVKCVAEQYSKYDKQLSQLNKETNRKEVIERSWFKRGTNLIVYGYRSGDQFMARGRQSEEKYPFYKILSIDDVGTLNITRYRADD